MISRRKILRRAGALLLAGPVALTRAGRASESAAPLRLRGRIRQSVCRWCYARIPLEQLSAASADMGLQSVDLVQPSDFPTLQRHGLICAMVSNPIVPVGGRVLGSIPYAWNRIEYHDRLIAAYQDQMRATAQARYPNLICFSGNRFGMNDEQGLENCVTGLRRIVPLAEKLGVTLCMELLNSKVNHKDYMCDHTAWGMELVRRVGSERLKLLYDIYHMQIMEGDIIATIRKLHPIIAHYHTGGVPGRHEIDQTQELNYAAVMRAIVATGYRGYVAQEFLPLNQDALAGLREGVEICDV